MILLGAALLGVLIAFNALYVAAEFAAVSVRRSRLRSLADGGDRLARSALAQVESPRHLDDFVAACQIGITLSSLALGAVGQALIAPLLAPTFARWGGAGTVASQTTAATVVLLGLTALQMILGELVPKSVALHAPTKIIRWTAPPMRWSSRLLAGFVAVLNGSGRLVLRALGQSVSGHTHVHSAAELELLVTESGEGGALEREDARRLRRALELHRRRARALMTPRPRMVALDADAPPEELAAEVLAGRYTRYPVYRGQRENLIGILHSRDLARRLIADEPLLPLEDWLLPVAVVPESMSGDEVMRVMRRDSALQLVVLDEHGGVAGILSTSDVLREVLGEMPQDFGGAPVTPERLADGRVRLPGRLPVDRAERWTGASWPQGSETVAGAVFDAIGHLPVEGERTTIGILEIEVERMEENAVVCVLVRALGEATDG